jgi:hypothetical protein
VLPTLSNDQFVLSVCFGAVSVCGLIMYFSFYLGRFTGAIRETAPVRTQLGLHRPVAVAVSVSTKTSSHEKAA